MVRRRRGGELSNLLPLAVAVVVVGTLYLARVVLVPIALAVLFSFVLAPVIAWCERIRVPRAASALLVVLLAVSALGAFGWMMAKQLVDVTEQLPNYTTNIRAKLESLRNPRSNELAKATNTVKELQKELTENTASTPVAPLSPKGINQSRRPAARANTPSAENPLFVQLVPVSNPFESVPGVLDALATAGIVVVFTFFMLLQREDLRNRFIRLTGRGRLKIMTEALDEASHRVSRYLLLQTVVNLCYAIVIGIALHFIGIPNAMLWGAIAGTLRFLPYIGPPIGALLPVVLSLAVFDGWSRPLMTAGTFLCLEIVVSNFLEPILYGAQTGVSPIGILFAAVFWTTLWGPIGLLLSTPLTVCLVVMGRHIPHLAFLQIILGDEPVLTSDARFYQRLLAMDQEEARQVLEQDLREKQLSEVYDSVVVPALSLVEQDRHRGLLDEASEKFIFQSTKELVEEQMERLPHDTGQPASGPGGADRETDVRVNTLSPGGSHSSTYKIVCMSARDEADEIVAMMLMQLLQQAGYAAQCIGIGSSAEMLEQMSQEKPAVVCISALPPFAVAHARTLYRKVREYSPNLQIVLGLWGFSGDATKIASRMGMRSSAKVCATLSQVVGQIRSGAEIQPELPIQDSAQDVVKTAP